MIYPPCHSYVAFPFLFSRHQKESCECRQLGFIYQGDMQLDGAEEQSQSLSPPQSEAGLDHILSTQIASLSS